MSQRFDPELIKRELGAPDQRLESHWSRPLLWASLLVIALFVAWSSWAEVNEVARGEAKVVPSSRQQTIQSLEGGILDEIMVREGEIVEAGQLLAAIDETRFRSAYMESLSQAQALRATIGRLEAEVLDKASIEFPEEVRDNEALTATERELFTARRKKRDSALNAVSKEITAAQRQLAVIRPLVKRRAVGEMEMLKLDREIAELKGRQAEIRNTYLQDAYAELADKKSELATLEETTVQRRDQLDRTRLLSPVRGVVNNIAITTRGGVIPPGEEIMQITPLEDTLVFETRIRPQDVAFIAPGMPATIRISAYDYAVYGTLEGKVERISSDTLEEETPRGEESYYRVLVSSETAALEHNGETLPIKPGMVATVDIETGERSVLSYLLRPFTRLELR
ncbi:MULTISPECIES: HlyD family efflux transporter periplasmic adaptor subunit [Cobetia]|uniref:HlyD family efflux transporter periplasmic adaptor subunit n=1 Tax=Cobetia marina TaxID=28258 RepID=A0ABU9GKL1_COBMA|nr:MULTISPECIES: HlyD family efflux transporter periplasmic adaptor subunit [Cobetia]AZV31404.1 hemolysin D [Cobetia sp. ICG0124]MDA5564408.1 HlyD family efflux transporter periplasmic adaptor subunit [Cobetia sp. MMG027]MDH2374781.1 HlyD family efflux transporter periplasmic adaptor subunit [Cobetia sp. 3AK]